jgi:hypothetical protein
MAVLFTSFLSAIGGGGGAAAGAAAGAAGAAAGAGSAFSTLATIASVGSTIVGGLASIAAGKQQQQALEAQAWDEDSKAVQETINGRQEALTAMRKLNADLAGITVAGYASGLSPEGSVAAAQEEALKTGDANINMARDNAAYASAARRGQASQLRREGRAANQQGIFGAITGGLSLFSRVSNRG